MPRGRPLLLQTAGIGQQAPATPQQVHHLGVATRFPVDDSRWPLDAAQHAGRARVDQEEHRPAVAQIGERAEERGQALGRGVFGPVEVVTPLQRSRLAAPFEALRSAVRAASGQVALVAVGSAAQSRARVEFCRAYFAGGGFTVVETAGALEVEAAARQFAATGAQAAVICSADAVYAEAVPRLVPLLRAAGATVVVLAGRPKEQAEALAAAGIELFVQQGGDALALMQALQRRMEVRS